MQMFNNSRIARRIGINMAGSRQGSAKGELTVEREHVNVFGDARGSILFIPVDHVGGAWADTTLGEEPLLVESNIRYLKGIREIPLLHRHISLMTEKEREE